LYTGNCDNHNKNLEQHSEGIDALKVTTKHESQTCHSFKQSVPQNQYKLHILQPGPALDIVHLVKRELVASF
jgi:hypothetical protein